RASSGTPKRKTATYGRTIDLPATRNTSRSTNGMQQTQINRPMYTPNDGSRVVVGGTTRSVPVSTAATGTLLRCAPRREHHQLPARQRPALPRQFFSQLKPEALRVKPQRRISVDRPARGLRDRLTAAPHRRSRSRRRERALQHQPGGPNAMTQRGRREE